MILLWRPQSRPKRDLRQALNPASAGRERPRSYTPKKRPTNKSMSHLINKMASPIPINRDIVLLKLKNAQRITEKGSPKS
jgi:hypothetical protein